MLRCTAEKCEEMKEGGSCMIWCDIYKLGGGHLLGVSQNVGGGLGMNMALALISSSGEKKSGEKI
jgi:hypothetical protein